MHRLFVAVCVCLFLLAGCITAPPQSDDVSNGTDGVANETDGATDDSARGATEQCPPPWERGHELPITTTAEELVEGSPDGWDPAPRPMPERPENLTSDSALEYATAYEEAYAVNVRLRNETTHIRFGTERANVEVVHCGYLVTLSVGVTDRQGAEVGDSWYEIYYFVSEDELRRAPERDFDDERYGVTDGEVLEAWPDR